MRLPGTMVNLVLRSFFFVPMLLLLAAQKRDSSLDTATTFR